MTAGRKFKKAVRERMRRTGESYSTARKALVDEREAADAARSTMRYEIALRERGRSAVIRAGETESYRTALEAAKVVARGSPDVDVLVHDRAVGKDVAGYRSGEFWEEGEL